MNRTTYPKQYILNQPFDLSDGTQTTTIQQFLAPVPQCTLVIQELDKRDEYSRTWIYRNEKFCMGGTEKIPIYRGIRYIYPCSHTNYPCRTLPNFAAFSDIQRLLYVFRYNGGRYIQYKHTGPLIA